VICARTLPRLAATLVTLAAYTRGAHAGGPERPRPSRIFHVMSYHSPWRWTDGQLQGFKDAMQGVAAEYRVFQLDTKHHSMEEEKRKAGQAAAALIDAWKPDLVYATDDEAQEYVTRRYLGRDLPFVFSGVNKEPDAYGFEAGRNVAGVLEHEHFVESVQLLRKIAPSVRRIAVVFDDAPLWITVQRRLRAAAASISGVEFGPWDTIHTFAEYQRKVREYHGSVDGIALIGIFNFKDDHGKNVPYQDVLQWTAENSTLPDLGFWIDRVHYGTLCAVTVSEREQGLAAGRIARSILAEGRSPSSFRMEPTAKGLPVISLARARKLGLTPTTSVLLSAEVIRDFEWEKR
jgi:ABC-type uncharacterized transport system substrate-binding protein